MLPLPQQNQVSPEQIKFAVQLLALPVEKACQKLQETLRLKRYGPEDFFLLTTLWGNEAEEQRAIKQRFRALCEQPALDNFWIRHSGGMVQCPQPGLSAYAIFAGHTLTEHGTSLRYKNYRVAVAWWGIAAQQYKAYAAFFSIYAHACLALNMSPKARDAHYLDSRVQALTRFCLGFKDTFPLLSLALLATHMRYAGVAYGRIAGQRARSAICFNSAREALRQTQEQARNSKYCSEIRNGFCVSSQNERHLDRFDDTLRQAWGISREEGFAARLEEDDRAAEIFDKRHRHGCGP